MRSTSGKRSLTAGRVEPWSRCAPGDQRRRSSSSTRTAPPSVSETTSGEKLLVYFYPQADTLRLHDAIVRHPGSPPGPGEARGPRRRHLSGSSRRSNRPSTGSTRSASRSCPTPITRSRTRGERGARRRATARPRSASSDRRSWSTRTGGSRTSWYKVKPDDTVPNALAALGTRWAPRDLRAADDRYDRMRYRACGRSGLQLPAISLGLWHNFGDATPIDTQRAMLRTAFDLGITHFDLANNYGPPYGSAETNFGRLFREDFRPYRDELDPVDQGRVGHVAGPVRPGRRLSQVPAREPRPEPCSAWAWTTSTSSTRIGSTRTRRSRRRWAPSRPRSTRARRCTSASRRTRRARPGRPRRCSKGRGVRCLIHQPSYNLLNRWIEEELLDTLGDARHRVHRLRVARPGCADRQVPRRGARRRPDPPSRRRHRSSDHT